MKLDQDFEELKQGTHLCSIYRNPEEQLSTLIPFMVAGLKNNEKCLSILTKETEEKVLKTWVNLGVDVARCNAWGQFVFLSPEDIYLKDGNFNLERMLQTVKQAESEALHDGFNGLRSTGEMAWFNSKLPGTERMIEYESQLNYLFAKSRKVAMCQYGENIFSKDVLLGALYTHPKVIMYGVLCNNKYYIPPEEFFSRAKKYKDHTYEDLRDNLLAMNNLLVEV